MRSEAEANSLSSFYVWRGGNCHYLCRYCDYVADGWSKLSAHKSRSHPAVKAALNLKDVLIDPDYVRCHLCNCSMLFDRPWIEKHLLDAHPGLTLKQYFLRHVFRRARVVKKECEDSSHGEADIAQGRQDREAELVSGGDPQDQVGAKFGAKSDPRVTPCSVVLLRIDDLKQVKREDQHTAEEASGSDTYPGNGASDATAVTDVKRFKSTKANSDEPCKQDVFRDSDVNAATVKKEVDEPPAEEAGGKGDVQVPVSKVEPGNEQTPRRVLVTTKIMNLCLFSCPTCGLKDKLWTRLRKHLRIKHGLEDSRLFYRKNHLVKKVLHQCLICGRKIICDLFSISQHVSQSHKLNMPTYRAMQPQCPGSSDEEEKAQKLKAWTTGQT